MSISKSFTFLVLAALAAMPVKADVAGYPCSDSIEIHRVGERLDVRARILLDSLTLGRNNQVYIVPVVSAGDSTVTLPAVLVNGKYMDYAVQRGVITPTTAACYDIASQVCRNGRRPQTVEYSATAPFQQWMLLPKAAIRFDLDECGCGEHYTSRSGLGTPLDLDPTASMTLAFVTPEVTDLPVIKHEGRAKVQFEVNKTVLHPTPYRARNGRMIDNREQLGIIEDSVRYALTDPNVEISAIKITGYASPESPYIHNEELASGRSRALAEYLARKYNLPASKSHYAAVAENWEGFKKITEESRDITEDQRRDLLALINEPAYGPTDYDNKEKTLKTDRRFSRIYKSLILPEWFPELRTTTFQIETKLKPMSDQQLAEVIKRTPYLMSLNQMFRVALLYPEGSDEFNHTIDTALKYYPDDEVANLNVAVARIKAGKWEGVDELLEKAGTSPEAENARGMAESHRGNFDAAIRHFKNAGELPDALSNLRLFEK